MENIMIFLIEKDNNISVDSKTQKKEKKGYKHGFEDISNYNEIQEHHDFVKRAKKEGSFFKK